ncbi:hypothetical protein BGZ61DRAFT_165948 [Ilyonectria robusta]|uniref:uncharacterized protein n=1 Tax=Ilyonectria robusta TaxID=1079257 RepID=UPI001E8CCF94|nr:uncharacterized protein BGZ61DRAFT_165948 [Ilyonectria robusta]KAH8733777.1 hypothetical protein BGZ61DRAFT_165948 [Ilyonectria robusta]
MGMSMRLSTWLRRAVGCRPAVPAGGTGCVPWAPVAARSSAVGDVCGTTGGRRRDRNSVRERDRGKDVEWGKYREMASAPVRLCVGGLNAVQCFARFGSHPWDDDAESESGRS